MVVVLAPTDPENEQAIRFKLIVMKQSDCLNHVGLLFSVLVSVKLYATLHQYSGTVIVRRFNDAEGGGVLGRSTHKQCLLKPHCKTGVSHIRNLFICSEAKRLTSRITSVTKEYLSGWSGQPG